RDRGRALARVALHRAADLLRQRPGDRHLGGLRDRRRLIVGLALLRARLDDLDLLRRDVDADLLLTHLTGRSFGFAFVAPSHPGRLGRVVDVPGIGRPGARPLGDQRAHRSTPPMIGSSIARFWIRSAIRPPTDMSRNACRLTNDGSRKWTRAGFEEPSESTKQPSS